jgi:peptidoglycan/LPS O-acetylase OafA/YrhL
LLRLYAPAKKPFLDREAILLNSDRHYDSFDILRLFAAALVLWTHHFVLTGSQAPFCEPLRVNYGIVGVYIFFAVSGYVNALSIDRRRSVASFLSARAVRIYPALAACVATTIILCAFLTHFGLVEYFFSKDTLKYAIYNSTMLRGFMVFPLPGVFETNPYPLVVNGSLWTLPIEATIYIVFVILMSAFTFRPETSLWLFILAAAALIIADEMQGPFRETAGAFLKFAVTFLAGSSIAALRLSRGRWFALAHMFAIGLILLLFKESSMVGWLVLLAVFVVGVGSVRPPQFLRPRFDISYGFYLYAFPLQQITVSFFGDFLASLIAASLGTITLATLSCFLVEQPSRTFFKQNVACRPSVHGAVDVSAG